MRPPGEPTSSATTPRRSAGSFGGGDLHVEGAELVLVDRVLERPPGSAAARAPRRRGEERVGELLEGAVAVVRASELLRRRRASRARARASSTLALADAPWRSRARAPTSPRIERERGVELGDRAHVRRRSSCRRSAFSRQRVDHVRAAAAEDRRPIEARLGLRRAASGSVTLLEDPRARRFSRSAQRDAGHGERSAAVPGAERVGAEALVDPADEGAAHRVRDARVLAEEAEREEALERRQEPQVLHRLGPLARREIALGRRGGDRDALDEARVREQPAERPATRTARARTRPRARAPARGRGPGAGSPRPARRPRGARAWRCSVSPRP